MMQADEVKKMVETCMKVHYGAGFQTVTQPDNVPCLGDAVTDAYVDLDKNVRVTAFVNVAGADILMPDAVGTSIMSAKRWRCDKNRYIFIMDAADEEDSVLSEMFGSEFIVPGVHIFPVGKLTPDSVKQALQEMLHFLDGQCWTVGIPPLSGERLCLLAVRCVCPHCNQSLLNPAFLIIKAFNDEISSRTLPYLISIEDYFKFSDRLIFQTSKMLSGVKDMGLVTVGRGHSFTVSCPHCDKAATSYDENTRLWLTGSNTGSNKLNVWYRWALSESMSDEFRVVPLPDICLAPEDIETLSADKDLLDGYVLKGSYDFSEIIRQAPALVSRYSVKAYIHSIMLHLQDFPLFSSRLADSPAHEALTFNRDMLFKYINTLLKCFNYIHHPGHE